MDNIECKQEDNKTYAALANLCETNNDLYKKVIGVLCTWIPRLEYDTFRNQRVGYLDGEFEDQHSKLGLPEEVFFGKQQEAELNKYLYSKLSQLSQTDQQIIHMRDLGQMRFKDIAETLKIPISTVNSRHKTALNNLRKKMNIQIDKQILQDIDRPNDWGMALNKSRIDTPFEYCSVQKPCTVLEYFKKAFGDDKTVCPGCYNDEHGLFLSCGKKHALKVVEPERISGEVSTEEAMEILGVTKNRLDILCNSGQLSYRNVRYNKGRKRVINLNRIKDCGQRVFNL